MHIQTNALLTLKVPSKKSCLLKSSAVNNCITVLSNLSIGANSVDTDQTAPREAVRSGLTLFVKEATETFQQTTKSDNFCDCHLRSKIRDLLSIAA